jgi:hypothetical protein
MAGKEGLRWLTLAEEVEETLTVTGDLVREGEEARTTDDAIESFFSLVAKGEVEIYNEFSLQHELGIHLRSAADPGTKVQFERSISFFGLQSKGFEKREIDICVFDQPRNNKIALELKFPRSGQYPEQMFKMCQDIRFLEQLVDHGFARGYAVLVADDPLFYERGDSSGIYQYFRARQPLFGMIQKPTGKKDQSFRLRGRYKIDWKNVLGKTKFAVVEIFGDNRA